MKPYLTSSHPQSQFLLSIHVNWKNCSYQAQRLPISYSLLKQ